MKDKNLRKALGIHGSEEQLCGCDWNPTKKGELQLLQGKIDKLEKRINYLDRFLVTSSKEGSK